MARFCKLLLFIIIISTAFVYSQTWNSFTTANGLSDNSIRCIATDSLGRVWYGTKTKGIQGYDGTNFIPFPKNSSLPTTSGTTYEITSLNIIGSKMYIGVKSTATLGGLWVYDFPTNTINWIGGFEVLGSYDIFTIYQAKNGQIYGGNGAGFYKRIADNNWVKIGSGLCRSIAEKSDGTIYYTTFDSLYKYDGTTKSGVKYGMFYSVAFDNNDVGYASTLSDVFKFDANNNFTSLGLGGYSKAIVKDIAGKMWIGSASNSFGLTSVLGSTVTTYTTTGSPLLSADMTALWVGPDNKKYVGHYSAGLNIITDQAVVLPISISPSSTTLSVGDNKDFTVSNGTKPYSAWVLPATLGTTQVNNQTVTFHASKSGQGVLYVSSANGVDTAKSTLQIADTGLIVKLPPTGLVVSKGKYPKKIDISWVAPGEFFQGFEDGIPSNWPIYEASGNVGSWGISKVAPHGGVNSAKFDVYNPGSPISSWLITEKIHISPEKSTLRFYLKTAYGLGNTYSSSVVLSTTNQSPASFTTTLQTFSPSYLADSSMKWRTVTINLAAYANQDVYVAFKCQAEDLIIYFDDIAMIGINGPTTIQQAVQTYKLYKAASPVNIQNNANVIANNLNLSYADTNILANKNYYYAVSAVYNGGFETAVTAPAFGIAYAQPDSIVLPLASTTIPVTDGKINLSEYADAYKTILTKNGYYGDLYLKKANNKLYVAVDFFGDTTFEAGDYVTFAFDKNRSFGFEDSVEGYYTIQKTNTSVELAYFPWTPLGFGNGYLNPTGFAGNAGTTSGHVQYEFSLDLSSSMLSVPLDRVIGAFVSAFDSKNNIYANWTEKALANEYSVGAFGSLTFPQEAATCRDVSLNAGWNIVSVPVAVSNAATTTLFPAANSPAYGYNNGYYVANTMLTNYGYWLRYPQAATVNICGTPLTGTIPLTAGWNLIGSFTNDVPVANLVSNPPGIINSVVYGYNGGYSTAATLAVGKGYWVRATQAGTLGLAANAKSVTAENNLEKPLATIHIADADGQSTVLYAFGNSAATSRYELPPAGPQGVFDARFATGKMAEVLQNAIQTIQISNAKYPVRVWCSEAAIAITDKATNGKLLNKIISKGEIFTITNPAVTAIEVRSDVKPLTYSLSQNYPNPFNPTTTITFTLPEKTYTELTIYNQLGQKVATAISGEMEAGIHQYEWNAQHLSSGVYLYELKTAKFTQVKKLVLMK